ncbi:MAG: BatD family protein [Sedimentisphaerales bacterium]|nr:BatD family protein [Sedimentisphaerales bacterium]
MKKIIATIIMITMLSSAVLAQINVFVRVQDDIYAGEKFRMEVVAENSKSAPELEIGQLSGFNPDFLGSSTGSSSSKIIINGRVIEDKSEYVSSWSLNVPSAGSYTIPGLTVAIDGKDYKTQPVQIEVKKPESTDTIGLEVKLSARECYVGQPVALMVKWYVPLNVLADYTFNMPDIMDESMFRTGNLEAPDNGGKVQPIENTSLGTIIASITAGDYKGKRVNIVEFNKYIIPRQAGEIEIDPISVTCILETGSSSGRRNSPFNDPFFDRHFRQPTYGRFQATAESLKLNVRPLPESGKPEGYYGLVGMKYFIRAELVSPPSEISVGTPLTLKIVVSGNGNLLDDVKMPDLSFMSGDFKIPPDQASPQQTQDGLEFTQTIRPLRSSADGLVEVPAITLPYFNYQYREYQEAKTEPIAIEVQAARIIEQADASGSAAVSDLSTELIQTEQKIAANHYGGEVLHDRSFVIGKELLSWWSLAGTAGPLVLVVISAYVSLAGVKTPEKMRARKCAGASGKAIKGLASLPERGSDKCAVALHDIVCEYIADKFGLVAQSLTASDCREVLSKAGVSQEHISSLCAILEHAEHSRYAGGAGGAGNLPEKKAVTALVKSIESQLKGKVAR